MQTTYFLLIIMEIILAMLAFRYLIRYNVFSSLIFVVAFYFILTLNICYLYIPNKLNNKYVRYDLWRYDSELWLKSFIFTFLSLFSFFVFSILLNSSKQKVKLVFKYQYSVAIFAQRLLVILLIMFTMLEVYLFVKNYSFFTYHNSINLSFKKNNASYNFAYTVISTGTCYMCALFSLVVTNREDNEKKYKLFLNNKMVKMCIFVNICIAFMTAYLSGDRSTLVAIVMGIFGPLIIKHINIISIKQLMKILLFVVFVYVIIQFGAAGSRGNDIRAIDLYDFFFPESFRASMTNMFAAIRYDYVDTIFGIKSTLAHCMLKVEIPYIFIELGNLAMTFSVSDTFSMGHFIFADGYVIGGQYFGYLYNGIMLALLCVLWERIAKSNDEYFNQMVQAVMCYLVLGFVRGGGGMSSFIKYLYLYILPIIILYSVLSGKKIYLQVVRGWSLKK